MPILYHLSPEYFSRFNPGMIGNLFDRASRRVGERGIFFAPNFRDALKWAPIISYVKGRNSRDKSKKQKRINEEFREELREDPVPWPPSQQSFYKTMYLYKVEVPHDIMRKIKEHNRKWNKSISETDSLMSYIGSWDSEVFVPEEFIPHINIVGIKKYKTDDLLTQEFIESNRPKSKGVKTWMYGAEPKGPPSEEEIETILEARKEFESIFSLGEEVKYPREGYHYNYYRYKILGINGRKVKVEDQFKQKKEIDLLEFLSKAIKIKETNDIPENWTKKEEPKEPIPHVEVSPIDDATKPRFSTNGSWYKNIRRNSFSRKLI